MHGTYVSLKYYCYWLGMSQPTTICSTDHNRETAVHACSPGPLSLDHPTTHATTHPPPPIHPPPFGRSPNRRSCPPPLVMLGPQTPGTCMMHGGSVLLLLQ
jgi:hypothetical protein